MRTSVLFAAWGLIWPIGPAAAQTAGSSAPHPTPPPGITSDKLPSGAMADVQAITTIPVRDATQLTAPDVLISPRRAAPIRSGLRPEDPS